ncbi:hypothetical protein ACFT5C_04125 [Streptomyces sp. NPDC057116]
MDRRPRLGPALRRSGRPVEDMMGKQMAVFGAAFTAVVICVVIL